MNVKNTQIQKGDIVDLTDAGLEEINKYKNDYNDMSAPIPSNKRDWRTKDIANLWIGMIVSIAVYQVASGLLVSGMSWGQALFTVVLGHTIVMGVAIALGHFGTKYGMTYPTLSKIVFGNKGTVFPSLIRAILGVFWFGVQAWIGGQAVYTIIGALYPNWLNMGFTAQFISFIIFWIMNVYIAASGSKAVKVLEGISAPILIVLSLIVIIWGLSTADWSLNNLLNVEILKADPKVDFWKLFWPALSAMIAFDGGIALSMPDYTRHCVDQKSQSLGQIISAPIMTFYISFVGMCGTAGGLLAFGDEIWEPAVLVGHFPSVAIRIIFSVFLIMAVLTTNVAGNLIPPVNIAATLTKNKFNYKTVTIGVAILALLARPWDSLSSAYNLIFNVTQLLGALIGPISGIYLVAYLFDYKTEIDVVDTYRTDGGKYFYSKGWNIPVIILFLAMTLLIFAGRFVDSLSWIFNNAYVFGVVATGTLYYIYIKLIRK